MENSIMSYIRIFQSRRHFDLSRRSTILLCDFYQTVSFCEEVNNVLMAKARISAFKTQVKI